MEPSDSGARLRAVDGGFGSIFPSIRPSPGRTGTRITSSERSTATGSEDRSSRGRHGQLSRPNLVQEPGFGPGDEVLVEIALEGPQSTTLGDDVAEAFRAEPEAARFFDSMPTFYRNNVARSIAGAKRPETRAKRISEAVARAKARQREA